MSYGAQAQDGLRTPARELRRAVPQVYEGYKRLHDSAVESGALDTKAEELIALAISVSKECGGCIAHHAQAAVARCRPAGDSRGDGCRHLDERRAGHGLRTAHLRRLPRVPGTEDHRRSSTLPAVRPGAIPAAPCKADGP
ncbi:carboxymuconolactone decarboxylase family protein [Streptomyces sp. NPDC058746]|uniref:carboxymuconolactone decarboxylase family protein n=1 Tax=Streptomyces sp. NPDC058746 TaxID=3346622 RepID=UPI00368979C7